MITSAIMATMGGVKVSPEEIIGEEPPEQRQIDDSPEARQLKFIEHLARMEELERKKHREWLASLGLADDE